MKVLIIGGTGNISSPLTRSLLQAGHEVALFNRGTEIVEGARSICGDRKDHLAFEDRMKQEQFDCVIDMIGYSPLDAESLVRAFDGRAGQIVFCSTVDVYTKSAPRYPILISDERKPSPKFQYAYDKARCEEILKTAEARGCFPVTIIRPAATYNDAWCPISLIGSGLGLLKRIREGKPVIVLGDGTSIWVSSHRDDVANAFVNAVGNRNTFGKSYNVTGDEWVTWRAYYSTAARVMNAPEIDFVSIPTDILSEMAPEQAAWCSLNFMHNNIFDNSAAKKDLGYRYTVSWEEGVRRMVGHHDSLGSIDNASIEPLYEKIVQSFRTSCQTLIRDFCETES